MSLRDKLKSRLQSAVNRFSGEYSEPAPTERIPYERGTPDENAKVVMAKLNRPGAAETSKKKS